tara:strand:- start:4135 stop:4368 length:234 start_codon:yes stop_codon:yes gene_type:complete
MFSQGDLVHVPENVTYYVLEKDIKGKLIGPAGIVKEPHLAIVLDSSTKDYVTVALEDGKRRIVKKESLFFNEVQSVG